jgi:hypothetical protein
MWHGVHLGKDSPDRQNNYEAPWTSSSLRLTIPPNHSTSKWVQSAWSRRTLPAGAIGIIQVHP